MCELLGMNCNVPTDIVFSFAGFRQRGGGTGPHQDGWGIAFYEGKGARLFHDLSPSAESEIAHLVQSYPIKSKNVISHIRRRTRSRVCVENTHPFQRELWGRTWVFAHNGYLHGIKRKPLTFYEPIGTTDSEHAFCYMLDTIRRCFRRAPGVHVLWRLIHRLADEIATLGRFNFLMCDSRYLYSYCTTSLCWIQRRAPFTRASLIDADLEVDFSEHTTPRDKVVVIATQPLTRNETWMPCRTGEFRVFGAGAPVHTGLRAEAR
jgi:predicted glutamine amidotransferase